MGDMIMNDNLYPIDEFNVESMCDRLGLEDCRFKPQVLTGVDSIDFIKKFLDEYLEREEGENWAGKSK